MRAGGQGGMMSEEKAAGRPAPKRKGRAKPPAAPRRAGPRAVGRGLEVLRLVAAAPDGLSLTAIATALELPKSSMLNVLRSLQAADYVAPAHGRYVLGSEALSLAAAISATVSFPGSLMPKLRQLADATGETVTMGVLADEGLSIVFLEVMESHHGLRVSHSRGAKQPIYASSLGQGFLAFMPQPLIDNLLNQRRWPTLTRGTITKKDLIRKIPEIQAEGAAWSSGGQDDGTMGVGCPVLEAGGTLRCSIAAGGPLERIRPRMQELTTMVKSTAEDMSRILGYQGPYPPRRAEAAPRARTPRKVSAA